LSLKQKAMFLAITSLALQLPFHVQSNAATTFNVKVGRFFNPGDPSAESLRFFPDLLKVHQGDIVRFSSDGFHGVSLLPAEENVFNWLSTYAGGVDRPFSLFASDPDEGAGAFKLNLSVLSPSLACGWPTQAACEFDGSNPDPVGGVLHSGLAIFPTATGSESTQLTFDVEINADPGEIIDVVDVVHPRMRMQIEVVPASQPVPDQAELDTQSEMAFGIDSRTAEALDKTYRTRNVKKKAGGKTTWTAWAGIERETVTLRRFYPSKLTIKSGDRVRWLFSQNVYSAHTVTFPINRASSIANGFPTIACDPDGDEPALPGQPAPGPDTSPTSSSPPYCDSYRELELDVPRDMTRRLGDGRLSGANELASSGVRGKGFATSLAPYTLTFTKPSRRGYSFMDMVSQSGNAPTGKVVVKGR
jgi:plastocyanin